MVEADLTPWQIAGSLTDGARITRLRFGTLDLLTAAPGSFRAPRTDYGRYETRPVYGYDDCFPTVDACDGWDDHGELCWLPWEGTLLDCQVRSRRLPWTFRRQLEFGPRTLTWRFSVRNDGDTAAPVQHVMHPLMPLDQIVAIHVPQGTDYDAATVARDLIALPKGRHTMLFLNGIVAGCFRLGFRAGLSLTVQFDPRLFPTLGIWWNNASYPDEPGLRRIECAFEPTPGPDSRLSNGTTLVIPPRTERAWQITWRIES